jgi:hypothetical protein
MAKTTEQKRLDVEEQIKQLENQCKQLKQKEKEEERKARNHRLCKRGGACRKAFARSNHIDGEQFQTLLDKTLLTEQTRSVIADITADKSAPPNYTNRAANKPQSDTTAPPQAEETEQVEELT